MSGARKGCGGDAGAIRAIGGRVGAARRAAGLTQRELGVAIGVTFQQVQKYESGRNRVAADRLLAIAGVTGRAVAWFFEQAEPAPPPRGRPVPARPAGRHEEAAHD